MSDFGSGIPSQIVGELSSIPKQVVKDTVKAFGDIASGTAEKVITSVGSQNSTTSTEGKAQESGQSTNDPMEVMKKQKEAAATRRLAEVRGELQEYYESQKKQKEQEEFVEEQQKQEEMQMKQSKKKQEEQDVLRRLSSQYGGTSETAKGGN